MPGSIFSWEAEDMLVEDFEESITANMVPSVAEHNYAGLVIAIALQQFEEDCAHREGWRPLGEHLRTTLRALDALPIIVKDELRRNKKVMIPGIVTLKVNVPHMRPKLKAFSLKGS